MLVRLIFVGGLSVLLGACQPKVTPSKSVIPAPEAPIEAVVAKPAPTLGQLGQVAIPLEHAQVFFQERAVEDSTKRDSLFRTFLQEYRYYLEAKAQGLQDDVAEEAAAYRDYLSAEFWEDTLSLHQLKQVTWQRYQTEVELRHILIGLPALPTPQDTLEAFRKASAIKQRLDKNELPFTEAARLYSQDEKTKESGGYLGWFGALQLVLSMENAAYSHPVGSLQGPIRTNSGYHLLLIQNKRPYSGQIRVRHLVRSNRSENTQSRMDSIRTAIQTGELTFEDAVQRYSEDMRNKTKGGELASFGIGERMDPVFEEQAFALQKPGDITPPFQTKGGWHLLQLIEKVGLQRSEAFEFMLEDKLQTDSRGEFLESLRVARAKKALGWSSRTSLIDTLVNQAPANLITKNWQNTWPSSLNKKVLFQAQSKQISVEDFAGYLLNNQAQWKIPSGTTPKVWLQHQLTLFEKERVRAMYTDFLQGQPQFEHRVQQHTRDLMVKLLLNETIWEKSVADTVGQRQIFERNKANYWQIGRMEGVVVVANEAQYLDMARELMNEEKPYPLRRGIAPMYFPRNVTELDEEAERRLRGLLGIMANNPTYLVEIGGHADVQEEDSVSAARMQGVSAFLQRLGLDYTRIQEIDFSKTRPVDRFDWQKNQRVTFQFLSNSREELAKVIQSKYGPVIAIKEGIFSSGEPWVKERVQNQPGTYRFQWEQKWYEVIVENVLPPRPKTIREARGEVIKAYQDYLLQEFDRKLAEKYPLTLDSNVVKEFLTPTHP